MDVKFDAILGCLREKDSGGEGGGGIQVVDALPVSGYETGDLFLLKTNGHVYAANDFYTWASFSVAFSDYSWLQPCTYEILDIAATGYSRVWHRTGGESWYGYAIDYIRWDAAHSRWATSSSASGNSFATYANSTTANPWDTSSWHDGGTWTFTNTSPAIPTLFDLTANTTVVTSTASAISCVAGGAYSWTLAAYAGGTISYAGVAGMRSCAAVDITLGEGADITGIGVTLVDAPIAGKLNKCVIEYDGVSASLYVVEVR